MVNTIQEYVLLAIPVITVCNLLYDTNCSIEVGLIRQPVPSIK